MLRIKRCRVSLLAWTALPQTLAKPETLRDAFHFLGCQELDYPPPSLPTIGPLKLTAISRNELQGLRRKRGVEKIWKCMYPHFPVQALPELGIQWQRGAPGRKFESIASPRLFVYLHPFGLASALEFSFQFPKPVSGYDLARLLDSGERRDALKVACHAFSDAANAIELFVKVRELIADSLYFAPDSTLPPTSGDSPFCILDFDVANVPETLEALEAQRDEQRELFSILRRATGNYQPTWDEFQKRRYMEIGGEEGTGDVSGWKFCTDDGIASHIASGIEPDRAIRARLCHHRNLVKLIGSYRLYQTYLDFVDRQAANASTPAAILEFAVNALDRMRIGYSRWWIRWGTVRNRLEAPIASLVARHGLYRPFPPHLEAPDIRLSPQQQARTMKDFFISYNKNDKHWAEWIAWTLEEAGYSVVIQAWDFRPGGNFVLEMQKAAVGTERTLAVLSEDYLQADYTQSEWAAAFAQDSKGEQRKLVPVRVKPCSPKGLLGPLTYVDLVELASEDARTALLGAFSERAKPATPPQFPGAAAPAGLPQNRRVAREPKSYPGPAQARSTVAALKVVDTQQDPESRNDMTLQERLQLVKQLNAIPPQQFNMLIFAVQPPPGLVPPMPAPQGDRSTALLVWAEAPGGCGLGTIATVIRTIVAS